MAKLQSKAASLVAAAIERPGAKILPRPSEFMRARRPELYSDSKDYDELIVESSRLEFHLDTMTARSEEKQFEHFARQLCQREICPNLRPQTGPTGGGDSKVDSDTFPVAQGISERWYVGDADNVGRLDLAFAFSAMKDWLKKVRADVKSIASTARPYTRIYFVSNQSIPDKKKGKAEDELRKSHGIPLTILDRTWLLEHTLNAKNIDLTSSVLGMKDLERERRRSIGSRDFAREKRYRELESRISDQTQYSSGYQLIEDALEAALLARGMGWSRTDVDGRFQRAIRLATEYGGRAPQLRARYLWYWSIYWWFDDAAAVRGGFLDLERQFGEGASVWELEYLVNLAIAAEGSTALGHAALTPEHHAARDRVRLALEFASRNKGAPTQSLWARTLLLFLRVVDLWNSSDTLGPLVAELRDILSRISNLPEYPTDSLLHWLAEFLEMGVPDDGIMELAEELIEFRSVRAGIGEKVNMRIKLAAAHLDREEPYAALEQLGHAQQALLKHNRAEDQSWQWALSAAAYKLAGLPWASRSCLVCAVASGMSLWRRKGVVPQTLRSRVRRLLWAEIQLGNVPTAIFWAEMLSLLAPADENEENVQEQLMALNAAFGIASLRASDDEHRALGAIPELYRAAGLTMASDFALVALGHADEVAGAVEHGVDDVLQTTALLLQQPIASQLRRHPNWRLSDPVELHALISGARVRVLADPDRDCVMAAETFLGTLEATLSITVADDVFASRDQMTIRVLREEAEDPGLRCVITEDECGEEQAELLISGALLDDAVFSQIGTWILPAIEVAVRVLRFPDENSLNAVFAPDSINTARGVSVIGVPRCLQTLLADRFPYDNGWCAEAMKRLEPQSKVWPLGRQVALHKYLPDVSPTQDADAAEEKGYLAHSQYTVHGLLQPELWQRGSWRGFSYAVFEDEAPILAIMFENKDVARKIFRGLRKRLGDSRDLERQLIIGAMTGIDETKPHDYRAVISVAPRREAGDKITMTPCLRQTLSPPDPTSREQFMEAFQAQGRYRLAPMIVDFTRPPPTREHWRDMVDLDLAIDMTRFECAEAWMVGLQHPLSMGFMAEDKPLVPKGEMTPPFKEVMAMIRRLQKR